MQQGGGAAGDISSRMGALQVHAEAKVPMEEDGMDQDEATVATAIGPQERRRLTLASMSAEDIVLCVDVGPEMGSEWAGAGPGGAGTTRLRVVQAALAGYVRRKSTFNHKHRFAVVSFGENVQVLRTMTSDVRSVVEAIERLEPCKMSENPLFQEPPFDFGELLGVIAERFPPPPPSSFSASLAGDPACAGSGGATGLGSGSGLWAGGAGVVVEVRSVVRAIVVFGRSYTCPSVPAAGTNPLLQNERFFLDCVYLHRKPSEEGVVCQQAFDLIAGMESSGGGNHSYFLECGHSLLRFNTIMVSLLGHPVQRDYQEAFFDKLDGGGGSGGVGENVPSNRSSPTYKSSPTRGVNPAPSSSSSSNPSSVAPPSASYAAGVMPGTVDV